ncbi:hypothetical protein [Cronobacter turicensis]|uniref:hypothetical protein n=1 Tax=Cronobacter turicensis TaxID=413502 RepID=UPI0024C3D0EE|nr:hypothetical protein [Cronobacter turicensis]MDK1208092.1 hypothetical protein [Cronobacter turicensis]MDK1220268.1 hypothetical protein [Cronobacter turicensis]
MNQARVDPVNCQLQEIPRFDEELVHRSEVITNQCNALRIDQVLLLELLQVMPGKFLHLQRIGLILQLVLGIFTGHRADEAFKKNAAALLL